VSDSILGAAIAAHVAIDTDGHAATLRQRVQAALAANATYLALANPTAA
jgi:hypothetical protein